jgi:putative ABC transport system substrate-binding protein
MAGIVRRKLLATLAGAVAWPIAARAQQAAMPVVGYLSAGSIGELSNLASAFRQGLSEAGFVEGRSVKIEYRWAEGKFDQVPVLAGDLIRHQVALIATGGTTVSLAAKAATATIPIVFVSGADVIDAGLVSRLNRPEGNLTGVNLFSNVVTAKRLQLLHELVPAGVSLAMLANPAVANVTEREIREVEKAADDVGRRIKILHASNDREIDVAFAAMVEQHIGGLLVQTEPFLTSRRDQLVLITTRHAIPTASGFREFPLAGGLMSYRPDIMAAHRQIGVYAARILNGAKPADLPVLQPTKFELVINLKTARALGLEVPPKLLALADEVIE